MHKIQELFDPSKQLNRKIESVVTFGANTTEDLEHEIKEYVVTDKLHKNYEDVLTDLQQAFNESSKEIGIWVSGFYGSGKSSFAKYLGLSFDKSLLIDGVTFGDKLMSRIHDAAVTAMHHTIISRHNPLVVMIDLSTESVAGKVAMVSDIVYFETLKQLDITKCTDQKVMCFVDMLYKEGKYEEFCRIVKDEMHMEWEEEQTNDLAANMIASQLAPRLLPAYFPDSESYENINMNSALNEKERFKRLYQLIKEKTGRDKVIFVLDEVGQYVASNVDLILNVQGMMQIFKDEFRGSVWVIATAQQTLTEDNRQAQLNSNELFRLNDRFPIKVDIEANDIKEIITKRLLGKSQEGKEFLMKMFSQNEGVLKNNTHLTVQQRSIYNQVLTEQNFADLYPFLPVHVDILLSLLQKLASRTGGVGLRSVIRLIRDILVDNHLADATIGQLAGPEYFYDVLRSDMEKNSAKEIVMAADKAIRVYTGNALAVRICKTIAVMQLLDDFNLSFNNICALLNNQVDDTLDRNRVRDLIDEIADADGLTLQEVEGKYQFMTNAILGIREERSKIVPREQEKAEVMQDMLRDLLTPAPAVNVYSSLTITAGVELTERNRPYNIYNTTSLKMNVRFVTGAQFDETRQMLLTESTRSDNARTLYWLCTLNKDKEALLQEIVKCQNIRKHHQNETNKEILAYLRAQSDLAEEKKQQLLRALREAQANSEIIFRGTPQQVNADTYKTVALKGIAEKVFEKYPLASANMKGDCVSKLAAYGDVTTIPDALNPFRIIKKQDGTIDTAHPALMEIKDFITAHSEATGQELMRHFEGTPYGWSKDTIRYLAALMLKAGTILLRVSGKNITVFGDSAVTAMGNNNSFAKVNFLLNTDGALKIPELLNAVKLLTSVLGCARTAPVKDQIAVAAYKRIKLLVGKFRNLQESFEHFHLAGLQTVNQAIQYAERIIDTEGGDAAYLLGKDKNCEKAFRYAMDIIKCDEQSRLIDQFKHMEKLMDEADKLTDLEQIRSFRSQVNEVRKVYNGYVANPDLHLIVQDVIETRQQLDAHLRNACLEFQTQSNQQLVQSRDVIMAMAEKQQLSDAQRSEIESELGDLTIESRGPSIDNLRDMINTYSAFYSPQGKVNAVERHVKALAQAAVPAVTTVTTPADDTNKATPLSTSSSASTVSSPTYSPTQLRVKSRITSRADLHAVIDRLTQLLDKVDDNSPVELIF